MEERLAGGLPLEVNKVKLLLESDHLKDQRGRVLALIEGMVKKDTPLGDDLNAHNKLMQTLAVRGDLGHALMVFNRLSQERGWRWRPNLASYNALLEGYLQRNDTKGAMELVERMRKERIRPTAETLNTIVSLGRKSGETFRLYSLMKKLYPDIVPLVQTFNMLIYACVKKRELNRALGFRTLMQRVGVKENEGTFNNLLKVMREMRDAEGAMRIYGEMKAAQVRPNMPTYNLLLKIFAVRRDVQKSLEVLEEMEREGASLNALSYSCLIELNALLGEWEKVEVIMKKLKDQNLSVGPTTFPAVIDECLREPNEGRLWECLRFFARHGLPLELDSLQKIFQHFERKKETFDFLKKLGKVEEDEGLQHSKEELQFLLRVCAMKGAADDACRYLQKINLLGEKVPPDVLQTLQTVLAKLKMNATSS